MRQIVSVIVQERAPAARAIFVLLQPIYHAIAMKDVPTCSIVRRANTIPITVGVQADCTMAYLRRVALGQSSELYISLICD